MGSWNANLAIGHGAIDGQHQALFEHVDALLAALQPGRPATELLLLFEFLDEYAWHHFALEERVMRESRYPGLDEQLAEHDHFRTKLDELQDEASEGLTPHLTAAVERSVRDWLVDHVATLDRRLGEFLARPRQPPAPAVPLAPGRVAPTELMEQVAAAGQAHSLWKAHLRTMIEAGRLEQTVAELHDDRACAFGRWIHGLAVPPGAGHAAAHREVLDLHAEFHRVSGLVGELVQSGRRDEALHALAGDGALGKASQALLRRLESWEG